VHDGRSAFAGEMSCYRVIAAGILNTAAGGHVLY